MFSLWWQIWRKSDPHSRQLHVLYKQQVHMALIKQLQSQRNDAQCMNLQRSKIYLFRFWKPRQYRMKVLKFSFHKYSTKSWKRPEVDIHILNGSFVQSCQVDETTFHNLKFKELSTNHMKLRKHVYNVELCAQSMNGENWPLVINAPVQFEK